MSGRKRVRVKEPVPEQGGGELRLLNAQFELATKLGAIPLNGLPDKVRVDLTGKTIGCLRFIDEGRCAGTTGSQFVDLMPPFLADISPGGDEKTVASVKLIDLCLEFICEQIKKVVSMDKYHELEIAITQAHYPKLFFTAPFQHFGVISALASRHLFTSLIAETQLTARLMGQSQVSAPAPATPELEQLKHDYEVLEGAMKVREAQLKAINEHVAGLEETISMLRAQNEALKKDYESAMLQVAKQFNSGVTDSADLLLSAATMTKSEDEKALLTSTLVRAEAAKDAAECKYNDLDLQYKSLKAEFVKKVATIDTLQQNIAEQTKRLVESQDSVAGLKEDLALITTEKKAASDQLELVNTQLAQAKTEIERLTKALKNTKKHEVEACLSNLESKKEVLRLNQLLSHLTANTKDLTAQSKRDQKQLRRTRLTISQLRERSEYKFSGVMASPLGGVTDPAAPPMASAGAPAATVANPFADAMPNPIAGLPFDSTLTADAGELASPFFLGLEGDFPDLFVPPSEEFFNG